MFTCSHCQKEVSDSPIGTKQRNHCPFCLWSVHLDDKIPGDRKCLCQGLMQPIGLTSKNTPNKKLALHATSEIALHLPLNEIGELMLVHQCNKCGIYSKNRIAGDDDPSQLLELLNHLNSKPPWSLLDNKDKPEVIIQLFGK